MSSSRSSRLVLFGTIALASLMAVVRSTPLRSDPPPAPTEAEKAIRKVLGDQVAAWNKGDLEGFMAGYWQSDDLSFYSGKDKTKGWKATLERYRKKYQGEGREM